MVADAEILLDQPLLSESEDEPSHEFLHSEDETEDETEDESEDEVDEDIYDAEYSMKLRKELDQLRRLQRLLNMITIVAAALLVYITIYGVKLPVPFYCTYQVFGYPVLWVVAIVFFMFAFVYTLSDWWRTTRQVEEE